MKKENVLNILLKCVLEAQSDYIAEVDGEPGKTAKEKQQREVDKAYKDGKLEALESVLKKFEDKTAAEEDESEEE